MHVADQPFVAARLGVRQEVGERGPPKLLLGSALERLEAGRVTAVVAPIVAVGTAAVGAFAEKPELMARLLIFVGLAEGIAIYGLIVAIILIGKA